MRLLQKHAILSAVSPDADMQTGSVTDFQSLKEGRPGPTGIAATLRRIAVRGLTLIIAAITGTVTLAFPMPIGGGPFVILGPIANLLVGLVLLAGVSYRGHSHFTCRLIFYSFTAPAWLFLLWAGPHFKLSAFGM